MGLVVAGERSGVGKTTVTLALLAALQRRSGSVQSFKVGPDYIDPMFHTQVTGRPCRNLDPVLTSEAYVQHCFAKHSQDASHTLVEGVMGLFDGASGSEDWASTAHIARLLDLPILLVLDCSRLSRSIAAIAHGYTTFDPRLQFAGLVLNRVGSDRHLALLQSALAPLNIPILGILHRDDGITLPDRHLGLIPTAELPHFNTIVDQLAQLGEQCFDWPALLPYLGGEGGNFIDRRDAETQREEGEGEKGRGERGKGKGGDHIHSSTHPLIHPSTHPPIHSSTHPLIHSSTHPPIHPSTDSDCDRPRSGLQLLLRG